MAIPKLLYLNDSTGDLTEYMGLEARTDFIRYNRINANVGVETDIINETLTSDIICISLVVGGESEGTFIFKVDGNEYLRLQNNWTERDETVSLGFQNISSGSIVKVSVINRSVQSVSSYYRARLNAKEA